jgi:cellulose synthase/poly-beta-1,6-N-acetylglucosamine synthase-like glycosyltransferase
MKDIVIPVRNEATTLNSLFKSLKDIDFENKKSVIFVNDQSTDSTKDIILSNGYKCIDNMPDQIGKKASLINGVKKSNRNFIIFNDADIEYPKTYSKVVENNPDEDYDIMILPIWIKTEKGLLNKLIRLDFAQIIFATFSFKGNLGSGANMVVKKESFKKYVKGYEAQLLSGDDYFLIKECQKQNGNVLYVYDEKFKVTTDSPKSIKKLISQRARWIKKTFEKGTLFENLSSLVIISNSSLTYVLIISFLSTSNIDYFALLIFKIGTDLLIFIPALFVNKALRLLYLLPLLELVYPFYYLAVILGTISKQNWKGRDL